MAHFAEIDSTNTVVRVLVVPDDQEHRGQEFLANDLGLGGTWIKTSYNTVGNQHRAGGTPLRANYAGIGFTYDPEKDVFYSPSPHLYWVLNEETYQWEPPTPMPNDGKFYYWDDRDITWKEVTE